MTAAALPGGSGEAVVSLPSPAARAATIAPRRSSWVLPRPGVRASCPRQALWSSSCRLARPRRGRARASARRVLRNPSPFPARARQRAHQVVMKGDIGGRHSRPRAKIQATRGPRTPGARPASPQKCRIASPRNVKENYATSAAPAPDSPLSSLVTEANTPRPAVRGLHFTAESSFSLALRWRESQNRLIAGVASSSIGSSSSPEIFVLRSRFTSRASRMSNLLSISQTFLLLVLSERYGASRLQ